GDVRRRLLAAYVLLARLQGEDIAALARGVRRLADDSAGHAARVLGAGGQETVVRPAERLVVACALALADRDRAPVRTGGLQHAERDGVDVSHRERAGVAGSRGELGRRLETAEHVRLLEEHA